MPDGLFMEAFALWGTSTTWLEVLAFALSLAMVYCNIREIHWGWPLAMASSALYGLLFWHIQLVGEASLQVFFIIVAAWGWWQWLRGGPQAGDLLIQVLSPRGRWRLLLLGLLGWPVTAGILLQVTHADLPWWDALPTALSVIGQVLLGRKYLENWWVWCVVNAVSVGLFAYKGLWLTVVLYALFLVLSVVGWRTWQRRLAAP